MTAFQLTIKPIRCSKCGARLFDARQPCTETSIREANIAIKCWRCDRIVGFLLQLPESKAK